MRAELSESSNGCLCWSIDVSIFMGLPRLPPTAPNVYNTVSGVAPREVPFRSIDLGEVALRPYLT